MTVSDGVSVQLIGAEDLRRTLNKMRTRMNGNARKVITRRAFIMRADLMQRLSKPGGGNKYRRGSRWHTASAPGEAPAPDTGRYRSSIGMTFFRGGLAAEVGTNLKPYPGYLEPPPIGDTRGISNRPAFGPMWDEHRELYIADMAQAVRLLPKG